MYDGLKNLEVPRPPRWRARRAIRIMVAFTLIAGLVFAVGLGAMFLKVRSNIEKGKRDIAQLEAALPGEPLNILVLGSDRRDVVTEDARDLRQFRGGSGQRADTIILVHVSAKAEKAVLVSFPRDLRVSIPGHGRNKINAAYSFGGAELMIKTVQGFTGLPIHHYVEVNFAGFRSIVDAVGGVEIYVNRALKDPKAGLDIPKPGCIAMDGMTALAFVRARNIDPTADLGRIQRQQLFMRTLMKKVRSAGVVLNPKKVLDLSGAVGANIVYDEALGVDTARSIAAKLSTSDESRVDFRIVPGSGRRIGGVSYVVPKETQSAALFEAMKGDLPLPPYGKTQQSIPEPGDVRVRVLNGSGVVGLAAKERSRLEKLGFDVVGIDNARTDVPATVISYAFGANLKASLIAKQYPGATIRAGGEDQVTDVIVTLGPDAAADPSATPTPGAKRPAKPKPKPKSPAASCG